MCVFGLLALLTGNEFGFFLYKETVLSDFMSQSLSWGALYILYLI